MKCIPPTLRWLELFRYVQPERGSITGSGMKNNKIKYTILAILIFIFRKLVYIKIDV